MDLMLPPHPFHLSTRGRWGGEYGIATRGYFVLPPIVSRFPDEGFVEDASFLSVVLDEPWDLWADAVQRDYLGAVDPDLFDLEGLLGSVLYRAVVEARAELIASIVEGEELGATVEDADSSADVEDGGMVGTVDEDTDSALVQDMAQVALVTDGPGEGCC